jgi:hypothetical protein
MLQISGSNNFVLLLYVCFTALRCKVKHPYRPELRQPGTSRSHKPTNAFRPGPCQPFILASNHRVNVITFNL